MLTFAPALTQALARFQENDPDLNAFIISNLTDLEAVEATDVVRQAFEAGQVNESISGEFYDFQTELGLIEPDPVIEAERQKERAVRERAFDQLFRMGSPDPAYDDGTSPVYYAKQDKKKAKAKRKKTEKMKKLNRKKKRR